MQYVLSAIGAGTVLYLLWRGAIAVFFKPGDIT